MSVGTAYCLHGGRVGKYCGHIWRHCFLLLLLEWRFAKMLLLPFQCLSVCLSARGTSGTEESIFMSFRPNIWDDKNNNNNNNKTLYMMTQTRFNAQSRSITEESFDQRLQPLWLHILCTKSLLPFHPMSSAPANTVFCSGHLATKACLSACQWVSVFKQAVIVFTNTWPLSLPVVWFIVLT